MNKSGKEIIPIASDHAGYSLKNDVIVWLEARGCEVCDLGTFDEQRTDYPDYAREVARGVSSGEYTRGILLCGSGIGMSIVANKFPGVRAALCTTPEMVKLSRLHNDANILVLAGRLTEPDIAREMIELWLDTNFEGERHEVRLEKIEKIEDELLGVLAMRRIEQTDPDIYRIMENELKRQRNSLELIASENLTTIPVLEAMGSVLVNKYAEGYPGRRYYGGCKHYDEIEELAVERAKSLFGAEHANVQPYSGTQANMSAYAALCESGDTILAMDLTCGGHLTHGSRVNFSGRFYNFIHYGVSRESEHIDFDEVRDLALKHRPKLIVAGGSAYPPVIDFKRFREIADEVGAYLLVDMAHFCGLVAGGVYPTPVPYSDVVTSTTHKTLRGPRAGFILCKEGFRKQIDKTVFPGMQGGPHMHVMAAKAICFWAASTDDFKEYSKRIVENAIALSGKLSESGYRMVGGGTESHLFLVDLRDVELTGAQAQEMLESAGIVVNKNTIPYDQNPPSVTSGIRVGTPAVTTRGMGVGEMRKIADLMDRVISKRGRSDVIREVKKEVQRMCELFPYY
ncbi:MAG: ribose 5-phosphate isomerase B [Candidatus Glassbacteria bacterium]